MIAENEVALILANKLQPVQQVQQKTTKEVTPERVQRKAIKRSRASPKNPMVKTKFTFIKTKIEESDDNSSVVVFQAGHTELRIPLLKEDTRDAFEQRRNAAVREMFGA